MHIHSLSNRWFIRLALGTGHQRLQNRLRSLLGLLCILLITACTPEAPINDASPPIAPPAAEPAPPLDGSIEIEYWQANLGVSVAAMDFLIEQFHEQHPHIRIIHNFETPLEDFPDVIEARAPAGLGPDVVTLASDWQPEWVYSGYLAPLPPQVFPHATVRAEFSPLVEGGFFNDELYTLPTAVRMGGLFYNRELMLAAGLDPATPPTTLEELESQAVQCTLRNEDGAYAVMGFPVSLTGQAGPWFREVLLRQFGQEPHSQDLRTVNWNENAAGYAAWEQLLKFETELGTGDATLYDANVFLIGRACFHIDTLARVEALASVDPDLDFGVAELPQHNDIQLTFGSYWTHGITQKGASSPERLDAAAAFLAFITTYEASRLWMDIVGDLPARLDALEDDSLRADPALAAFLAGLAYAQPAIYLNQPAEQQILLDAYNAVVFEDADPRAAFDAAVAALQSLYDDFWQNRRAAMPPRE